MRWRRFWFLARFFYCPDCGRKPLSSDDFIIGKYGIYHIGGVWCGPVRLVWRAA